MISIIVCSYKQDYYEQFVQNVEETIGIRYEIIKIHNPGLMGICEAYNKGANKAKYSFLCFSHEDVLFKTLNWGNKILGDFESDEEIGLIGFAGSAYKPWVFSGWGSAMYPPSRFSL